MLSKKQTKNKENRQRKNKERNNQHQNSLSTFTMFSQKSTSPERQSLKGPLSTYKKLWGDKGSQTAFFRENIPLEPVDFTETSTSLGIKEIFTSEKVCTQMRGSFNCNMVYRQTKVVPDILVYSDDNHDVLQPLGEPGRDLGDGDKMKASHLMVVTSGDNCPITLNEMLPTTAEENADTVVRHTLLISALTALQKNHPISKCGARVITKAKGMGCLETMGIREFMARQISSFSPEFLAGTPGYKLLNEDNTDIAQSTEKDILGLINTTFNQTGRVARTFIQGPDNCSQLLSHIHGFLLSQESPFVHYCLLGDNYISVEDIFIAKGVKFAKEDVKEEGEDGWIVDRVKEKRPSLCEMICGSSGDEDEDEGLTRQLTTSARSVSVR